MKTNLFQICLLSVGLLILPAVARAQFQTTNINGSITITKYTGSGGKVAIPGTIGGLPVTSIGDSAFHLTHVTSVTIPDSVTSIGNSAFAGSTLASVTIGTNVNNIGASAFFITPLTSVTIPASVTNIGDYAFEDCADLTSIYFDGDAPTVDLYTFETHSQGNTTAYYLSTTGGWVDGYILTAFATGGVQVTELFDALLTVSANGEGSISPNYNGVPLQIGSPYSLTAKPAKGFVFTDWTDDLGDFLTNGATLNFIMASNLTVVANFLDTIKPTVSITSPKTGEKWSNSVFTVTGTSGDNVAITNVLVSVNGGSWTPATPANGWTNWSATANLVPGTNTIAAYAVSEEGNFSLTNTVKLNYILSAPLTVVILPVGSGTVNPNDNGKLLAIGVSYSLTAVAAKGYGFYYWSGGVPMSNNPKLTFTMASNLTIIANFRDVTKPTVAITFPTANQKWSNSVINVTGTASDNVGVTGVGVQINNGGWLAAETANGYTSWTATNLPVVIGQNILQAYAMDAAGNVSLTNEIKFTGVAASTAGFAPASLAGYAATLKPSVGKQEIIMTWGDSTWAQAGTASDTNVEDYAAGTYMYITNGLDTAVLTNVDIGMFSGLGTTNVTTVNLTFTSATSGSYAWTNGNNSGLGTMTLKLVTNLVPASIAGMTMTVRGSVFTFAADGTFIEPASANNGETPGYGTYTFTQYSPTVAILQLNYNDPRDNYLGAVAFVELTFTTATSVNIAQSWYANPLLGSNPDNWGQATGTIK